MLMQNFQSAADLGITEDQRSALMKALVLLETGKLVHAPPGDDARPHIPFAERKFSGEFNMMRWSAAHECGSVCCIGGTAEMVGQLPILSLHVHAARNPKLGALFFPGGVRRYSEITPAQAATALRSYLTTGDAKWHEAVATQEA